MPLIDSHCHLTYPEIAADFAAVLARAKTMGVTTLLTISTKEEDWPNVLKLTEDYSHIYGSIGIHPHEAETHATTRLPTLQSYLAHKKIIALGETGLDYFYEHSPRAAQKWWFLQHITLAQETGLPLIIHTREAEADTWELLYNAYQQAPFTAVIHCFTASKDFAEKALSLGFYISFSGIITFKKAEDLQHIVPLIPEDKLLIETDSPYLAPTPMRGKPNEPSYIVHTAECMARLRGCTLKHIEDITSHNFYDLFTKAQRN